MKKLLLCLFGLVLLGVASADVWVNGYFKSNGTYVNGYRRTDPDCYKYNNYSWKPGDPLYNDSCNYLNSSTNSYKPTSYAAYAPIGACIEEKEIVIDNEAQLKQIEFDFKHVEEDILAAYTDRGGSPNTRVFEATVRQRQSDLIKQYTDLYDQYTKNFENKIQCLEKAGYQEYIKPSVPSKKYMKTIIGTCYYLDSNNKRKFVSKTLCK